MKTLARLIQQHITTCENDFIRVALRVLDKERPWFGVFRRIDMKDTGNHMRIGSIHVHGQSRIVSIEA
jgi:hypothetical protein